MPNSKSSDHPNQVLESVSAQVAEASTAASSGAGSEPCAAGHNSCGAAPALLMNSRPGRDRPVAGGSQVPQSLRSRGAGLPARLPRPVRTIVSKVRWTAEEYDELRHRAAEAHRRISPYLRECSLGRSPRVIPVVNRETAMEVARVGASLHLVARRLNERAGDDPTTDEIVAAVANVLEVLSQIRQELLRGPRR